MMDSYYWSNAQVHVQLGGVLGSCLAYHYPARVRRCCRFFTSSSRRAADIRVENLQTLAMSFCPRLGASRSRKSEVSAPAGRGSGGHGIAQPIPNRWVSDTTEQRNNGNREPERWWSDSGPHGSFPKTEEQARSHIEWIRREKRVDQPDANARALNAVLKE